MAGHGSPPPDDRGSHPNRNVSRPNAKGDPMQRILSANNSINNIEAKAGGMNIPVGHHLYKEREKHIKLRNAARAEYHQAGVGPQPDAADVADRAIRLWESLPPHKR
jgi:hypothetical protein